ncbi:hypothetical protein CH375_21660, partial [Leptospira ellisii]
MYQKAALRIFFSYILAFLLGCSLIPSQARITSVSGGSEILLPFQEKNGFRFVSLSLSPEEKPLRFLVDTGSRFSFLDEKFFGEQDPKKRIAVTYPGGKDDSVRRTKSVRLFSGEHAVFRDLTV